MHISCYANTCLIVRRSSAPRRHVVFLSMRPGIVFLPRLLWPRLQETCRRLCSSGVCPFHWHISNTVVLIWVVWCLFAWIDRRSSSKLSAKYSRREQTYVTKSNDIWSLLNCPQCVLPDNYGSDHKMKLSKRPFHMFCLLNIGVRINTKRAPPTSIKRLIEIYAALIMAAVTTPGSCVWSWGGVWHVLWVSLSAWTCGVCGIGHGLFILFIFAFSCLGECSCASSFVKWRSSATAWNHI